MEITDKLILFSGKMHMGDMQSEEGRDVVLELKVQPKPQGVEKLLDVQLYYFNVITNSLQQTKATLSILLSGMHFLSLYLVGVIFLESLIF